MTPEEIEQQAKAFRENYIKEWPIQKVSDQIEMMADFALHYHNQQGYDYTKLPMNPDPSLPNWMKAGTEPTPKEGEYWMDKESHCIVRLHVFDEELNLWSVYFDDGSFAYNIKNDELEYKATHAEITQYWKDRIAAALPSDEKVAELFFIYDNWSDTDKWAEYGKREGAKWMRDKLKDL